MRFPAARPRRLRRTAALRRLSRETSLSADDLILPLFVAPGSGVRAEVASMPGVHRLSVDRVVQEAREAADAGVGGLILFGLPPSKDEAGSQAWADDGVVQRALRALKETDLPLVLFADTCLCEYTAHGHCGVLEKRTENGREVVDVRNDETLPLLARAAVSQAKAGADVIAPSDMMDGRVAAIRAALDEAGFDHVPILSYAAKFASAFYGPFRDAADSAPQKGDRRGYQMDGANGREAMREIALDLEEGADAVMVKPALPYLDVVAEARARFDVPIAAYHVSGEYASIVAAARAGWLDRDRAMMEALLSIRRAGADWIVTYFAREAARLLAEGTG